MRATVDSYEQATDSYFVAVDGSGGRLREVLADQLAPIAASDPVVPSDLPELGVFTAPAPRDRGGARNAAAAILLGAGSPPPLRGAQGDGQSRAQGVSETPPATAWRPKSSAQRTDDTGTVEDSGDDGDDGDGEDAGDADDGALHGGDDVDEDGDDVDEDVIGTDTEGESDEEPNVEGPVVDLTADSDSLSLTDSDALSDSDSLSDGFVPIPHAHLHHNNDGDDAFRV